MDAGVDPGRGAFRSVGDATPWELLYAGGIGDHYETLGVPHDASEAQIRAAYRRQARHLHPDRRALDPAGGLDSERMVALNAAYGVLRDPTRRSAYDGFLAERSAHIGPPAAPAAGERGPMASAPGRSGAVDDGPARIPWRRLLIAGVVASGAVLVSSFFVDPPAEEDPDGVLRIGSCVAVEESGDVREVGCTGVDDRVVELVIPLDTVCPSGLEERRYRLGLVRVCLAPRT